MESSGEAAPEPPWPSSEWTDSLAQHRDKSQICCVDSRRMTLWEEQVSAEKRWGLGRENRRQSRARENLPGSPVSHAWSVSIPGNREKGSPGLPLLGSAEVKKACYRARSPGALTGTRNFPTPALSYCKRAPGTSRVGVAWKSCGNSELVLTLGN